MSQKSQPGQMEAYSREKIRIFENNIFGLDIDHQAVEVARSALLLKILSKVKPKKHSRIKFRSLKDESFLAW